MLSFRAVGCGFNEEVRGLNLPRLASTARALQFHRVLVVTCKFVLTIEPARLIVQHHKPSRTTNPNPVAKIPILELRKINTTKFTKANKPIMIYRSRRTDKT